MRASPNLPHVLTFKGGWENWAQVEIACFITNNPGLLGNNRPTPLVERELASTYDGSPKLRTDLVIPGRFAVELKVFNPFSEDFPDFCRHVRADHEKLKRYNPNNIAPMQGARRLLIAIASLEPLMAYFGDDAQNSATDFVLEMGNTAELNRWLPVHLPLFPQHPGMVICYGVFQVRLILWL